MVSASLALHGTSNRLRTALLFFYHLLVEIILFPVPVALRRAPKELTGQTVLITGSGSGIGQLVALKFLRLGCRVIQWDVSIEGMTRTAEMAKSEGLDVDKLRSYRVNLLDRGEIYDTADKVKRDLGPVDVLVNNAGIVSGRYFLDNDDERMENTYRVNTWAHVYTIKAFLPEMIQQRRGHLVTVASVAGHGALTQCTDYCGSKFANVGMEYSLRLELAQAGLQDVIKTTIVKPYFTNTGMFQGADGSKLYPTLTPESVADKLVEGVRYEIPEVIVPSFLTFVFAISLLLPPKCVELIYDFFGGFECMTQFVGRHTEENKPNDSEKITVEMNNNQSVKSVEESIPTIKVIEPQSETIHEPLEETLETIAAKQEPTESIETQSEVIQTNGDGTQHQHHPNGKKRRGSKTRKSSVNNGEPKTNGDMKTEV